MRVTAVEPILLRGAQPYGAARDASEASDNGDWQLLVRVATDEGLTGWADVETLAPAAAAVIAGAGMASLGFRTLGELLVGEDPRDVARLWDRLCVGSAYYGRRGIAMHCISAIDNCLWSIRAQSAGMSLARLLGGRRHERVTAYASTLFRDAPEAMRDAALGYVERGFRAVKFGWGVFGEDAGRDRELVAAAREALGPERTLLIDPGWYAAGWHGPGRARSRREAEALCVWLAEYDVGWVEDFIHPERFEEYAAVRAGSAVPVAAGEQVETAWDFARLIGQGCVDVVQPDLSRCGGISVGAEVASMAERANIDVIDFHERCGARAADHHHGLIERLDARRQRLMAQPDRIKAVRQDRRKQTLTQFLQREIHARVPGFALAILSFRARRAKLPLVIFPSEPASAAAVAAHYDELDRFYREVWGEHVHHGYWLTGRESAAQAAEALVELVAARLRLRPGQRLCDIGCGYGATAQHLAERYALDVTGVTISAAQAERARRRAATRGKLCLVQRDWLENGFEAEHFDRALAIESSEHMADKQRFFDEAFRTLRPDGLLAVCAWLARTDPQPWEVRHLLEPICREARLPSLGDEGEYCRSAERAGFEVESVEDLSERVRRTWSVCIARVLRGVATRPQYRRFLGDRRAANRVFAVTLVRLMIAYRTRSMRYALFLFRKRDA